MIDDPDIYRAAKVVIERHGDAASRYVLGRVKVHMQAGDILGCATWRRIREAIDELIRGRRDGESLN